MRTCTLGRHGLSSIAALALALTADCDRGPAATVTSRDASVTSVTVPGGPPNDGAITRAIRQFYDEDPALTPDLLDVKTSGGVVTVSGAATSLLAARRAIETPKVLRGVRAVIDEIRLAAPERSDADIRRDVEKSIRDDPAIRAIPVTIDVRKGVVTLRGTTASWQEKRLADEDASAVPAVIGVEDHVDVIASTSQPDDAIAKEVRERIAHDVWLEGTSLEVSAAAGVVTLAGSVATVAQRERAADDAWVLGVRGIKNERVEVTGGSGELRPLLAPGANPSDARVLAAVNEALRYDARVGAGEVRVGMKNGSVRLTGIVADGRARESAIEDARNTVGVLSVTDDLKVRTRGTVSDAKVDGDAQAALEHDSSIPHANNLAVRSTDGVLTVSGALDSVLERDRALRDLAGVRGVERVVDETKLAVPPDVLRARVQDLLAWDPLVGAEAIRVSVSDDRVVKLTGSATAGAARAATEDARRLGAQRVEDELARPH